MADAAPAARGFDVWRLACWMLLLLAAFGILQYVSHAGQGAALLRQPESMAGAHATLRGMLAWDVVYLGGACLTLSASAGALLRREWARRLLRVVAALLALWALGTAIAMLAQWTAFQHASDELLARPGMNDEGRAALAHARRTFVIGFALKVAAVPLLAWLAWRLGVPSVRAQFRARAAQP